MSKILKKQTFQKPYKQIILERLNKQIQKNHKKSNNINTLKTQCTPNEKTQQIYEKVFQQFDDTVKLKYKPVSNPSNKKSLKRSMYVELLQIKRNGLSKQKQKLTDNKQVKKKCFTQNNQKTNEKQKLQKDLNIIMKQRKSGKNTRQNTSKKSFNDQKYKIKQENFTLKRQISSTNFPITFKRSQSVQLFSLASKTSPNVEKKIIRKASQKRNY